MKLFTVGPVEAYPETMSVYQSGFPYFRTEEYGGISEKNYIEKAIKSTDDTILNSLASEVYKLNKINNKKMNEGKKTIVFFSISCGIISVLMMMVAVFYLVA